MPRQYDPKANSDPSNSSGAAGKLTMTTQPSELSINTLLLKRPPGTAGFINEALDYYPGLGYQLKAPDDLLMHCEGKLCNGERYFELATDECDRDVSASIPSYPRLAYHCANCGDTRRVFILEVIRTDTKAAVVSKVGERPPYGPPVPSKLMSLIGPERETFLKGRRCENQGLGVGAFSYYRRVVEMQRAKIFDGIIAAAGKLKMEAGKLEVLRAAAAETQFSKSLEMAKDVMPEQLLIQGHSPLKLLHAALSHGVHNMTDEECLERAESVRVVLGNLAEAVAQVTKDEAELTKAVSVLLKLRTQSS